MKTHKGYKIWRSCGFWYAVSPDQQKQVASGQCVIAYRTKTKREMIESIDRSESKTT